MVYDQESCIMNNIYLHNIMTRLTIWNFTVYKKMTKTIYHKKFKKLIIENIKLKIRI